MQKEDFQKIKENMKARKITGTYIAFQTSRSASNINDILHGTLPTEEMIECEKCGHRR